MKKNEIKEEKPTENNKREEINKDEDPKVKSTIIKKFGLKESTKILMG